MTSIEKRVHQNRDEILEIAASRGARNIRIFGSVARHEARPESDVDFLVEMGPHRSLFDVGGLVMDLQDLLGCRVDVVTEKGLSPHLRDQVLSEAVPV